MNIEEKYNILLARIKRWADLEESYEDLKERAKRRPDMGDGEDEARNIGVMSEEAHNALECRDLLKQIGELGNEALN